MKNKLIIGIAILALGSIAIPYLQPLYTQAGNYESHTRSIWPFL